MSLLFFNILYILFHGLQEDPIKKHYFLRVSKFSTMGKVFRTKNFVLSEFSKFFFCISFKKVGKRGEGLFIAAITEVITGTN